MKDTFDGIFNGLTVLVTGHTGFKGSWLSIWLRELGAKVIGYSLNPPTPINNFSLSGLANKIVHITGDVRHEEHLRSVIKEHRPEIIFHLAAQAIVLNSYQNPRDTFDINAMGTVNLLEAARHFPFIKALVMITTDKCYENKEWIWGYREQDPLGGNDPYSASKAMAELAIASYRSSFFSSSDSAAVASARAGNVIGGGDFSDHRIIPDTMQALMKGTPVHVRNPASVRPWLNVLDPLSGYLLLAARLIQKGQQFAQAWNFGPLEYQAVSVGEIVEKAVELWGNGDWTQAGVKNYKPEMHMLRLNWDKAANFLQWQPTYTWEESLEKTVDWFKSYFRQEDMYEVCFEHIEAYMHKASERKKKWAVSSEELIQLKG